MTSKMRENLIRYGDIIFLDAQKRQYNKLCWPYIGPVVRSNKNRIRCIAESVVIKEDISIRINLTHGKITKIFSKIAI